MGGGWRGNSPERARSPDVRSRTPTRRATRCSDRSGPSKENDDVPRIQVVVRKRPISRKDTGSTDVLEITDAEVVIHEPKVKVDLTKFVEQTRFCFDRAFGEATTTEQMYMERISPLVAQAFRGARCTCLAYGQTGSGKTHTMLGCSRRGGAPAPGLLTLCCEQLLQSLEHQFTELRLVVSAFEIYCEKLYDLLNNRNVLFARENARQQVVIQGLHEEPVTGRDQLLAFIETGLASRKTERTAGNADSSRSHCIVQLRLVKPTGAEHGKLSFVDLAGSERGADVGDVGKQTRKDGAEINKSLLALKECIRAMDMQKEHQPFRGSKLTQVLKDSLVGEDARTVLIATVNPSSLHCEHTLNTLRYAWRVRELKSGVGSGLEEERPPNRPVLRALRPETEPVNRLLRPAWDSEPGKPLEDAARPPRADADAGPKPQDGQVRSAWDAPSESDEVPRREAAGARRGASADTRGEEEACDSRRAAPLPEMPSPRGNLIARIDSEVGSVLDLTDAEVMEGIPANPPKVGKDQNGGTAEPSQQDAAATMKALALQERHEKMMAALVDEEEHMITSHRRHIDSMVAGLKDQMETLNQVDQPGSDVEHYVKSLLEGLQEQEKRILELRAGLRTFKKNLGEERLLSEEAEQLQREVLRAGGMQSAW